MIFNKKKSEPPQALDQTKEMVAKRLLEAERLAKGGRFHESQFEVDYVLQMDPRNYYARSLQERIRMMKKKAEEKSEMGIFTESAAMDKKVELVADLLKVADFAMKTKDYDKALDQIAKVFSIDPSNSFAQAFSERIMMLKHQEEISTIKTAATPVSALPPSTPLKPASAMMKAKNTAPSEDKASNIEMYKEVLREMWFDGKLTAEESDQLQSIRECFKITAEEHIQAEREVKVDSYIEALRIAWRDGVISDNEQRILSTLRQKYAISMVEHISAEARILWAKDAVDAKGILLLVEDDKLTRLSLSARLKEHGYTVLTAEKVEDALEILKTELPDLILSDVMFDNSEDLDGFKFYALVRQNPKLQFTPFLLMSGISDEFVVRAGMRMGVDDFLTKPLNFELLLATIEGKLKNNQPS